jgi:hypothetical protein
VQIAITLHQRVILLSGRGNRTPTPWSQFLARLCVVQVRDLYLISQSLSLSLSHTLSLFLSLSLSLLRACAVLDQSIGLPWIHSLPLQSISRQQLRAVELMPADRVYREHHPIMRHLADHHLVPLTMR